jgi:hypothetical protein
MNTQAEKPYLAIMPNGEPFTAILKFNSRKEAIEAQQVIASVGRISLPVKFFARVGHGKTNVQFYADSIETAKTLRNRYFRNSQLSWTYKSATIDITHRDLKG